jgi:hypothetical protein
VRTATVALRSGTRKFGYHPAVEANVAVLTEPPRKKVCTAAKAPAPAPEVKIPEAHVPNMSTLTQRFGFAKILAEQQAGLMSAYPALYLNDAHRKSIDDFRMILQTGNGVLWPAVPSEAAGMGSAVSSSSSGSSSSCSATSEDVMGASASGTGSGSGGSGSVSDSESEDGLQDLDYGIFEELMSNSMHDSRDPTHSNQS